jgi:hypothetical protein
MDGHLIGIAQELVHARPETEDEARAALEWIAARRGMALHELMAEQNRLHPLSR